MKWNSFFWKVQNGPNFQGLCSNCTEDNQCTRIVWGIICNLELLLKSLLLKHLLEFILVRVLPNQQQNYASTGRDQKRFWGCGLESSLAYKYLIALLSLTSSGVETVLPFSVVRFKS